MTGEQQMAFVDGTERVDRLLSRNDLEPRITEIREQMRTSDRIHAMTLAMVRSAARLTQEDMAGRLNVTQGAVARTEKRGDMLLSTLRSYLSAAGARDVSILVELADGSLAQVTLAELNDASGSVAIG
jgi:DNA-binding XRE family transcriptional regulator